jgi:hypothetical protein
MDISTSATPETKQDSIDTGLHAGGVIWQPFNMSMIDKARKENQRNKNQKRIKSMK